MLTFIILSTKPQWVAIAQIEDDLLALRCQHCASLMQATTTPAGEPCLECINPGCAWTVHLDTVPYVFEEVL